MTRSLPSIVLGIALAAALLAAPGCTGARGQPSDALAAYLRAVQSGRYRQAYAMMSDRWRRDYSEEEFTRALKENRGEIKETLKALRQHGHDAQVTARLTYGPGDHLDFVVEGGRWRLDQDPLDFYSQRTPREALRSFVRALERRRYDRVLRFVPSKWRPFMTEQKLREQWEGPKREEAQALLKNLKAHLDARIDISGNRATMPYGDRFECKFVKEDGHWKIEDPD